MASQTGLLTIGDLRGGRNGVDSPLILPETQVCGAINVDWYQALVGQKRRGSLTVSLSGSGHTLPLVTLIRHLPSNQETDHELWAIDNAIKVARLVNGVWSPVAALPDTPSLPGRIQGASFNGKLFLAYKNAVNRFHVWDGTSVRRVGLAAPAAPVVTALGAGSITGQRWYRVTFVVMVGGVITRRSEPSAAGTLAITSKAGWQVARPALVGEGETHWEIYAGNTANGPWYLVVTGLTSVLTFNDGAPLTPFPYTSWPGTLIAPANANTLIPAVKYVMVDEARLIMAGSFDPQYTFYHSRVWWTPILNDASGVGNDERLNFSGSPYIDFDPGHGGEITGLGGPLYDSPYVFKYDRIYKMVRTGLADAPYRPVTVSTKCGAIHQRTIVVGEDETGNEAIYFLSRRGPYRIGVNGLQYCGRDIEDLWAKVILTLASSDYAAHGVYDATLKQVWWWVPDGIVHDGPAFKLVFDVRRGQYIATEGVRGGWCQHRDASANAWSSANYSAQLPAETGAGNSFTLKPYIGQYGQALVAGREDGPVQYVDGVWNLAGPVAGTPRLWRCDEPNRFLEGDNSGYAGSILTRAEVPGSSIALHGGVIEAHLLVQPQLNDCAIQFQTNRDFNVEFRTASFTITGTAGGALKRVILSIRDVAAASAAALQIQWSDTGLTDSGWFLDQIVLRVRKEEDR